MITCAYRRLRRHRLDTRENTCGSTCRRRRDRGAVKDRKIRFSAGDVFGALSGNSEDLREAVIIAATPGRVLELSNGDFEHLVATRPGLREHMRQRAVESVFADKPF